MSNNIIIEGFFYRLKDKNIFYAKGITHPPGYVVSFPKYVVDLSGDRISSDGIRYSKLATLSDEYRYVLSRYGKYIRFDKFFCREVVLIPLNDIEHVYNPIEKAEEFLDVIPKDAVLRDVKDMVYDIVTSTGVKDIGVSGSVLIDLYRDDSDIDIVVYGLQNGRKVYEYLLEAIAKDRRYGRYTRENVLQLYKRRAAETPITLEQLVEQESRRVLEGFFKNREYFVRLVKYPWEELTYGSYECVKLGKALLKMRIIDARESICIPYRYKVEVIEYISGVKAEVSEIYSLRGRFAEVAKEDEVIIAYGTVEHIKQMNGNAYYRLYLGDENDYLIIIH